LYSFRAFFFIFYGEQTTPPTSTTHRRVLTLPLLVLAGLSLIGGWIEWPQTFGDVSLFREFIHTAIPEHHLESHSFMEELAVQLGTTGIGLLGIFLAYVLVLPHAQVKEALSTLSAAEEGRGPAFREGRIVRLIDWFLVMPFQKTIRVTREDPFDRVYATLIVHPYRWLACMNKDDFFNHLYDMVVYGNRICHQILGRMQTGQLGWYARMLGIGAVVVIGLAVFS
jgi:NADH-quinone oxidoreductase subunit L